MQELVVIGGGVGGLVVSSVAGQLGVRTTLVERAANLGGDCLHYGCVPSKSLIQSAKVASLMRRGREFGLPTVDPDVELGAVMDRVREVIDTIQVHDDPDRFRGYGVDVVFGAARFTGPREIAVNGRRIEGRRFVIATGSGPAIPPVNGLDTVGYLTNETVFSQRTLPHRLAVLGGGPIGTELAQAFARLGSRVTILEMAPGLLMRDDSEQAEELRRLLEGEGIRVETDTTVTAADTDGSGAKRLHCRRGDATWMVEADEILVAAGRRPNVDALNLDAAGVAFGGNGIQVDRRMRTTARHIFACGDCCGPYPFTHMAEYQAGVVISNAVFRIPKRTDYRVVPWVTYTDPELARVGMTETEARERGFKPQVLRFHMKDVDRALAEGEPEGMAKLVVSRGRLIGASILCSQAGEVIHELILAMQRRIKIGHISAAIHAYPTLAQVNRRAVNTYYAPKLYSAGTRRLVRWIQRLLP